MLGIGKIICRFEGNSADFRSNMRELGDYFRLQQISGYQPYFSVKDQINDPDVYQASSRALQTSNMLTRDKFVITERMIEDMMNRAEFCFDEPIEIDIPSPLSSTTIYLSMRGVHADQSNLYPISGFPRYLITEDTVNGSSLIGELQALSLTSC